MTFVSSPVPGISLKSSNLTDGSGATASFCDIGEIRILNRRMTDRNVAVEDLQL